MIVLVFVFSVFFDFIGCFDCVVGDGGGFLVDVEVGCCLEVGLVVFDEGWWGGEGCKVDFGGF